MGNAIYFISDLHLGSTYDPNSRQRERHVVDFLRSIAEDVAELYLVGDILDYWWEYRTVVPRGYVRFFGALAELADRGVRITWFIGNHDIWLFDYLSSEIGLSVVDGFEVKELYGKRFFISHGDGLGKLPRGFRFMRSLFRNKICQKLYGAIHPRWTIPFAHKWSSHSRKNERCQPDFDVRTDHLAVFANQWQIDHPGAPVDYFIFGHRHILVNQSISEGGNIVILGDWLTRFSFARWDGNVFSMADFPIKSI